MKSSLDISPVAAAPFGASDERAGQHANFLSWGLRCPRCGNAVSQIEGQWSCAFASCSLGKPAFPSVDGQPILIDENTSIFGVDDVMSASKSAPSQRKQLRRGLAYKMYKMATPSNQVAARNSRLFLSHLQSFGRPRVLVIGGGTRGLGADALWAAPDIELVSFDVYASPNTAFVADAHRIPIASASVSAVWIQAVLEHVLEPAMVVKEIVRVLKPGGLVYAETPFLQHVHEGAYDFTRFTHSGHRWLFRDFEELASGEIGAAGAVANWSMRYLVRTTTGWDGAGRLAGALTGWLAVFDKLGMRRKRLDAASGVYFLGRKTGSSMNARDLRAYYDQQ